MNSPMLMKLSLPIALCGVALSGCATTSGPRTGPVEVSRYHLSQPIPAGSFAIQPAAPDATGPEAQLYLNAVATTLTNMGFTPAATSAGADYLATVAFERSDRGQVRSRPPVTIGLGGGSFGGGVGLGGGVSTGIGGKTQTVYGSALTVQLRRRGDNTVIWEGKAVTETLGTSAATQPDATAARMSEALFKGFPGQSGITMIVK